MPVNYQTADVWLRACGWHPGRDVGIENCGSREMEREGWKISPEVQLHLRELSGLTFEGIDELSSFWVDGRRAVREVDEAWTEVYRAYLGIELVPVGERGDIALMCEPDGTYWGIYMSLYEKIGSDPHDLAMRFGGFPKIPLSGMVPKAFLDILESSSNYDAQ